MRSLSQQRVHEKEREKAADLRQRRAYTTRMRRLRIKDKQEEQVKPQTQALSEEQSEAMSNEKANSANVGTRNLNPIASPDTVIQPETQYRLIPISSNPVSTQVASQLQPPDALRRLLMAPFQAIAKLILPRRAIVHLRVNHRA
jgi:hypothetical protein